MKETKQRNELIDFLRGFAVLLVILLHLQIRIPFEKTALFQILPHEVWVFFFRSGNLGVRIFFVISGFLITSNSLARWGELKNIDYKSFYLFRFARIAPPLILLLAVLGVLHFLNVPHYIIDPAQASYGRALFAALTFHLNWLEGQVGYLPASWDVLWSLSVEEIFYLFFPLICIFCRKRGVLLTCLSVFVLIGPFYRASVASNEIWAEKAYLCCMDSIAIGCITALLVHGRSFSRQFLNFCGVVGAALMVLILVFRRDEFLLPLRHLQLNDTIIALGTALVLVYCVHTSLGKRARLLLKPLTSYGRWSYEIYLTHMFVAFLGLDFLTGIGSAEANPFLILVSVVLFCGALGYVVERFYSEPLNRRIRRFR